MIEFKIQPRIMGRGAKLRIVQKSAELIMDENLFRSIVLLSF